MAKQIVWTERAESDRLKILEYWINRNKSKTYSKKLNNLFNMAVEMIASHPEIGKPSEIENIKIKIVRDYLIVYEDLPEKIFILTIFDSRRNPDKLKRIIKKK